MTMPSKGGRSILQRRNSVTNALQCLLDGAVVLGLTYGLIHHHVGVVTADYMVFVLLLMGAMAISYDHLGIYRNNADFATKAWRLFRAWSTSFLFLMLMGFLTQHGEVFSRLLVGELFILGYLAQLLIHVALRMSLRCLMPPGHMERVLIVGTGGVAVYLNETIQRNPWLNQSVAGFVSLDSMMEPNHHLPVLGVLARLPGLIDEWDARTVYFAIPLETSDILEGVYGTLLQKNVNVHWIPDIFCLSLFNHSLKEIAGLPIITLSETPMVGTYRLLKAVEDYVLAGLMLTLLSPLLLIISILIKIESAGPVFFRQKRNGWNGKTFSIWKFRSMYVQPPDTGEVRQAQRCDPRVTRMGRLLRRSSLDELPQLFNVLTGDMSLVGPRPHAIQHDVEYARRIDDYMARQKIKPGITGLAQVRGLRGETDKLWKMIKRVESDIEYINNWSISLDLLILFRTLRAFAGKNAY